MGFSLIEALLATVILSGSVLALASISTNALNDTTLNRHYETAAGIIDEHLSLIDCIGIDQFLKRDQLEGENTDLEPGYRWEVTTEYEGTDNLYIVTITVTWLEGKRPYSIKAKTMLDGTGLAAMPAAGTVQP